MGKKMDRRPQVERGAHQDVRHHGLPRHHTAEVEVLELEDAVSGDGERPRLEVAVDDLLLMNVPHGAAHLRRGWRGGG